MDDIRRQFGVDGADIHAKFADLYIKVTDKYTSDTNQNIKDTNIALQTTLGQKLANNAAKATADAKVLSDFQTQQDKNSTERATAMVNGAKEMSSILTAQQDRKDKKAQQILDNKYRDTVHEDAVKAREDALAASIQTHKDALAASTLLHSDAATAHRDAAAIAETDKQATAGRAMRDKFATSIKTDPEIVPYDEFNNNIYARFQALTKDGKLTTANPETAVMLTDLFANANNPKLTARMPTQVVDLYNSNLSPTDKAKKFMDNFMGGGNMNARMMTDMTNALDDIHTKLQENAQNALDVYTLRAIHENSLMPAGYRYLGIDKSTLEHGDLNVLTDLGNSDSSSNVQSGQSDGDIFNGVPAKPNTTSFNPKTDLQVAMVGDKNVTAQPYVVNALQQADDALFAATGQHIQVNESYRDTAAQTAVYNKLSKTGGRVAPPGQSFHEKGLAVDIANWKESAPYLAKFGLVNGLKDDMGHFSVGEMNPTFAFQSSQS